MSEAKRSEAIFRAPQRGRWSPLYPTGQARRDVPKKRRSWLEWLIHRVMWSNSKGNE